MHQRILPAPLDPPVIEPRSQRHPRQIVGQNQIAAAGEQGQSAVSDLPDQGGELITTEDVDDLFGDTGQPQGVGSGQVLIEAYDGPQEDAPRRCDKVATRPSAARSIIA